MRKGLWGRVYQMTDREDNPKTFSVMLVNDEEENKITIACLTAALKIIKVRKKAPAVFTHEEKSTVKHIKCKHHFNKKMSCSTFKHLSLK